MYTLFFSLNPNSVSYIFLLLFFFAIRKVLSIIYRWLWQGVTYMLTNLLNYFLMEEKSFNMVGGDAYFPLLMVIIHVRFVQHWITHEWEWIWTESMTKLMSGKCSFLRSTTARLQRILLPKKRFLSMLFAFLICLDDSRFE